jgi:hypothetical protein
MNIDHDTLETIFACQSPTAGQEQLHLAIREAAKAYTKVILDCCPPSRERSLALTAVQESVMWANACVDLELR